MPDDFTHVEVQLPHPLSEASELINIYCDLPTESRSVLLQLARLIGKVAQEIA